MPNRRGQRKRQKIRRENIERKIRDAQEVRVRYKGQLDREMGFPTSPTVYPIPDSWLIKEEKK